jgi:hypothetical protein
MGPKISVDCSASSAPSRGVSAVMGASPSRMNTPAVSAHSAPSGIATATIPTSAPSAASDPAPTPDRNEDLAKPARHATTRRKIVKRGDRI